MVLRGELGTVSPGCNMYGSLYGKDANMYMTKNWKEDHQLLQ